MTAPANDYDSKLNEPWQTVAAVRVDLLEARRLLRASRTRHTRSVREAKAMIILDRALERLGAPREEPANG